MVARLGILALLAVAATAQDLLPPDVEPLPPALVAGQLDCQIEKHQPYLDFFFRFEADYLLSCPIRQFEGRPAKIETVVRVIPEHGYPVILGSLYTLPAMPSELRSTVHLNKVNTQVGVSEGFSIGEGKYEVQLVAFDDRHRTFRHTWKLRAELTRSERSVDMTLPPGTVEPLAGKLWTGEHRKATDRPLTILLNVAPVNPHARQLRAWDRSFLLGSLSSVLRGLSYSSVRLVAFNLDQQREIFRAEHFDETSMPELAVAMQKIELGTVAIDTLNRRYGWLELLHSLAHEERVRQNASDAVIFLGPWSRLDGDSGLFTWNEPYGQRTRFYDITFYGRAQRGSEFTDGIQRFTRKQEGVSYRIHSPGELAQALQKLNLQLQEPPPETSARR